MDELAVTLVNTAVWVVGVTAGTLVMSLFLAHALARLRGGRALAALLLVPSGATLTVVAVAWRSSFAFRPAFRDQVGIVNGVLDLAGVGPVAWLTQEPLVNTVVLATAAIWALTGLAVAVLVAAIRRVPEHLLDAARASGAGEWTVLRRVVVPSVAVPLVAVGVGAAVVALRSYDLVAVGTGGQWRTQTLATSAFDRSFVDRQPIEGLASSLVLLAGTWVLVGAGAAWRRRRGAAVEPIPHHRAVGRRGRHSATADDERVEAGSGGGGLGLLAWRIVALAVVVVWLVPVVGLVVTALRPAADAEASGWWTAVTDPSIDLSSIRTVLDDGMWAGVVTSSVLAVAVAGFAVLAGRRLAASATGRTLPIAGLTALATVPASLLVRPGHDLLDVVGLADSVVGAAAVHLVLAVPLAALVLLVAGRRDGSALAGAATTVFLLVWNDLLVATTVWGDGGGTATVRLAALVGERVEEQHLVSAAALVTALVPVLVLVVAGPGLARLLLGPGVGASGPDRVAGVDVEEVHPLGPEPEGDGLPHLDAGLGLDLGDAHHRAGRRDLVESVGVAGDGRGGVDREVEQHLRAE